MKRVGRLLSLFLLSATISQASGSEYPNHPIRLVVPFSAGGPTDTAARLAAEPLQKELNVSVIVENRPGASGVPGTESVVRSGDDGYTLVVGGIAPIVLVPQVKTLSYDVKRDLVPLGLIWHTPQVFAVRPALGLNSVAEFIAYATKHSGKVTVGSAGVGTVTHLANELFQQESGAKLLHVPYRSTSNSLTDLMGGQIDSLFGDIVTLSPQVKAGSIKALAVTSARRSLLLPDVPTMSEVGLKNVQTEVWYGLFASSHAPAAVIARLKAAVEAVQVNPDYKEKLRKYGIELDAVGADAFARYIDAESSRWGPIVKRLGIAY